MKHLILAAAIAVGLAVAQELTGIPRCGQQCINNMLAKAEELGCGSTDVACLCRNQEFANGIRDCTFESCPPNANREAVIEAGAQTCAQALAQVSGVSVVTTATTTLTAVTITTDTDATAPTRSVTITETQSPLSTNSVLVAQNFTGVLVEGGVAVTTTDAEGATFVTTLTGVPTGLGNATASPNVTEVVLTTTNSVGSTVVSTATSQIPESPTGDAGAPTETGGAGGDAAGGEGAGGEGAGVRLTAAGFAGVVGMVAMFFL